jgi:hypothetical protein
MGTFLVQPFLPPGAQEICRQACKTDVPFFFAIEKGFFLDKSDKKFWTCPGDTLGDLKFYEINWKRLTLFAVVILFGSNSLPPTAVTHSTFLKSRSSKYTSLWQQV